ncbi:MAG: 2,3,4,5-tetrahydropyridine-2,6-dicarboxylate N-succinyltransferase [Porticoccaceae bacterium]
MTALYSVGLGIGTQNHQGNWLEVFYPQPLLGAAESVAGALRAALDYRGDNCVIALDDARLEALASALDTQGETALAAVARSLQGCARPAVATVLAEDRAPTSVPEAYLKLHLLSHRLVKPHTTVLTGIFGVLPNVAWTNEGAIDLSELAARQLQARRAGKTLSVDCIDKFPRMAEYIVPSGVRIADTARVRLGAYIGEGTTIMQAGFVNFNAGTEGPNMIEGRVSAGVFVGAGSDLGGSSSTMGTLSGGGNIVISVGRECLIGANAGIGIPLGDRCIVEAGLYITAGTRIAVLNDRRENVGEVKARDLANKPDLLFRRNSATGAVECLTNKSTVELNQDLHTHN